MNRLTWLIVAAIGAGPAAAPRQARAGDDPAPPRVPPGFIAARAAADGAVRFPMFAAFDERGRLFVAESSGLDLYAEIAAGTRRCRVSVLEDRDGDGSFESSRVFAEGLVFPMGLAWRDGRLYVADPPDLVALEDRDGDGRADRRTAILTGFGHTDNGSLHGLVFGPDGLLYMTMGMPDGYRLDTPGGPRLEGRSGALIRCRPDGSRPQVVARGFVNLVEVAFLPGGDAIGTDNWYQEPAGGLRDALVHLVEGGLYPYVPDEGTPQPVTGDPLPPIARFPAVALSGLVRHHGLGFPSGYRGNLFSTQHNARRVARHILVPDGATFRSEDRDFLTTEDPDFHPSDVLEDADGSLLVVDTGAWYVQHCPTGRIRASRSTGGIYRVRWGGAPRVADPRGLRLDWAALPADRLASLLADPRPAVRERAGRALAGRGAVAIGPLGDALGRADAEARVRAVWALAEIVDPAALPPLRAALGDTNTDVACAAARALMHRADRGAAPALVRGLASGEPRARLAAAEALAQCGDPAALSAIWRALAAGPDPFLAHALIHAAHRLAGADALEAALARPEPLVQGAALLLLDQPPRPRGRLGPAAVVERASSPDAGLRRTALRILGRHPEWSGPALGRIRDELGAAGAPEGRLAALADLILAFQDRADVQGLLARAAADRRAPADRRVWALTTMARSNLVPLPASWVEALAGSLGATEPRVHRAAVATAAVLQVPALDEALLALADRPAEPPDLRVEALRAALPRHRDLSAAAFELLLARLGAKDRPLEVLAAAEVAGRARLDDDRRVRLLAAVRGDALVAPAALGPAFAAPLGEGAAAAWLDHLEASIRAGGGPPEDELRALLGGIPPALGDRRAALERVAAEAYRDRRARLAELEPFLTGGDPIRGRAVFFGTKVACATCHRIGDAGGRIGPDLTRIGAVRSGQDLLESIAWPSSTFAQGYEPYAVATVDGRVLVGVIVRRDAEVLILRDASGAETRLRRDEVEGLRRSGISLMPDGLARALTRQQLRDLLAFLRSQD